MEENEYEEIYDFVQITIPVLEERGIVMTGFEEWEELEDIWEQYILQLGEFLWDAKLLRQRVEEKKRGSIKELCEFVLQYK